jgi:hypothetical protein
MKPSYIDPTGKGTVALKPPFMFRAVTSRVFPLKANMGRLTQFVDQYLNMDIPDSIVHFTPALPYVYFTVLNYGGMSPTSRAAQHAGWIAQHEVCFTVLLQRWRRNSRTGKLVFQEWASISPFIYVDDAMSQTTGREVYGWPKVLAHIDAETPLWTAHPRAGTRLFSMSTEMFAGVYAGDRESASVLLEVERDPVASYAEFPANLKCPWSITSVVPNMISSSLSLMGDALDIAGGFRLRGYPAGRSASSLLTMGVKASGMAFDMLSGLTGPILGLRKGSRSNDADFDPDHVRAHDALPKLFANTVNLKQYRDPERPDLACYTALVNSRMGIDRVNKYGLLGDWDLLRGDPSGGYSVKIHRNVSQPIIETLGLEITGVDAYVDNSPVAVLKPSFPFWVDVDMIYAAGEVICSRTPSLARPEDKDATLWVDETPKPAEPAADAEPAEPAANAKPAEPAAKTKPAKPGRPPLPVADTLAPNAFNTALGAATQSVTGPFDFPDVTLQVYPLLADQTKLARFVDATWNQAFKTADGGTPRMRVETLGSYVYMVVSVNGDGRGTMWSASNNVGWWAEREVSFCIPVGWYRDGELVSAALIEPVVYANHGRAVITDREVNGRASVVADIDSPKDVWSTADGPSGDRRLLHVGTEIFPSFGAEQRSGVRTLIEVDQRDALPAGDKVGWQGVADNWGRSVIGDLKRKARLAKTHADDVGTVKALALEVLGRQTPMNRLTMKQYRDAGDMDRACYQSVVLTERTLTQVYDIQEIERRVHVRIDRVPGHPIVESLGLKVKSVESRDGNLVEILQPIRPFWMHVAVKEALGRTVGLVDIPKQTAAAALGDTPSGPRPWHFTHPWFKPQGGSVADPYFVAPGRTRGGLSLIDELADGDGGDLLEKSALWLRRSVTNQLAAALAAIEGLAPEPAGRREKLRAIMGDRPDALAETLCALPDDRAFRSFSDAMTATDVAALADRIEAAFATAGTPIRPVVEPGKPYGATDGAPEELAFEPWWFSPEWAAYILNGAPGTAMPAPRAMVDQYRLLNDPPDVAQDSNALLSDVKTIARWIMTAPHEPGGSWSDMISTPAKFSVWNLWVACRWMDHFDYEQFRLLALSLPVNVWRAIRHLLRHRGEGKEFFQLQNAQDEAEAISHLVQSSSVDDDPTGLLKEMADGLLTCVYDWKNPERWLRKSRREAGAALTAITELQLVVESILSDEWGSTATSLRTSEPYRIGPDDTLLSPKRPTHSVPVRSFGPFGLPDDPWAENAGLARWPSPKPDDRDTWEFVALD